MDEPRGAPCPACTIRALAPDLVRNASSRYVNLYICTQCGTDEAVKGFFWQERARTLYASKIKPGFQ